jgi:hypothetical protein
MTYYQYIAIVKVCAPDIIFDEETGGGTRDR